MPFISKKSGHGRIPGIHKPAKPPAPAVSNTATTVNSLTFTISNYLANWKYTATISPSGGTISFSGATISVTGLTASTSYTLTLTARNSGGFSTNTATATTSTPPPFFPSFAPFFPFFPSFPFFPFFPSFPFFPFFPSFPSFPFFPRFGGVNVGVKTAPSSSIADFNKIQILTDEYGYLEGKYLTEDDIIKTINIEVIGPGNIEIKEDSTTKITNIESSSAISKIYYINNEAYPENCYLLCNKDGQIDFVNVSEINSSDKIFNYEYKEFREISCLKFEEVSCIIYNISCDGIKHYVIQNSLGYFS